MIGACDAPGGPEESAPRAFAGSAGSVREIAERTLEGLTSRDTVELRRLRLSGTEHNEVVWPELPAARNGSNFPVDYAWTNIQLRNRRALARLFPRLAGAETRLIGTECRGAVQAFETFRVHTDCWVRFATDDGREIEAQLFKDVLEREGGFKVFRFYEEPYTEAGAGEPSRAG